MERLQVYDFHSVCVGSVSFWSSLELTKLAIPYSTSSKNQLFKVAWLRSDSKAILAIHTHMVTNNPRMSVSHNGHNSWTLSIDVVQRNDSGLYMCQINTEPMTSQVSFQL